MSKKKSDSPEPIEVRCPKCGKTEIVYIPIETFPVCKECHREMVIEELLDEGKSF